MLWTEERVRYNPYIEDEAGSAGASIDIIANS